MILTMELTSLVQCFRMKTMYSSLQQVSVVHKPSPQALAIVNIQFTGRPHPPASVLVILNEFHIENFSIIISWEAPEYGLVDEYRIEINTTTQTISTNTTSVVVEGENNIPLEINISAINCAGSSTEVTEEINLGMDYNYVLTVVIREICSFPPPSQLAVLLPLHLSMAVLVSSPVPG